MNRPYFTVELIGKTKTGRELYQMMRFKTKTRALQKYKSVPAGDYAVLLEYRAEWFDDIVAKKGKLRYLEGSY